MYYKIYGLKDYVWKKLFEIENEKEIMSLIDGLDGEYSKALVISYDSKSNTDSIYCLIEITPKNSYKRKRSKKR